MSIRERAQQCRAPIQKEHRAARQSRREGRLRRGFRRWRQGGGVSRSRQHGTCSRSRQQQRRQLRQHSSCVGGSRSLLIRLHTHRRVRGCRTAVRVLRRRDRKERGLPAALRPRAPPGLRRRARAPQGGVSAQSCAQGLALGLRAARFGCDRPSMLQSSGVKGHDGSNEGVVGSEWTMQQIKLGGIVAL